MGNTFLTNPAKTIASRTIIAAAVQYIPVPTAPESRVSSPTNTAKGGAPTIARVPAVSMNDVNGMLLPTPLMAFMSRVP